MFQSIYISLLVLMWFSEAWATRIVYLDLLCSLCKHKIHNWAELYLSGKLNVSLTCLQKSLVHHFRGNGMCHFALQDVCLLECWANYLGALWKLVCYDKLGLRNDEVKCDTYDDVVVSPCLFTPSNIVFCR